MKKGSKREEIINTAALLFRKRGYTATSVRDIAREMGMEASSLYNHIASKQEILNHLLLSIGQLFSEGMKDIKTSPLNSIQKLERLVDMHVRLTIEHTDAISLIPNEWIHLEAPAIKNFLVLRDEYEKEFTAIVSEAIDQSYVKEVNIELAVFSILSTLRWLYSWYSKNKSINPIELETEMRKCLIDGLRISEHTV